jgi:glc operon protein GlcG
MNYRLAPTVRTWVARGTLIALLAVFAHGWKPAIAARPALESPIQEADRTLASDIKDATGLFDTEAADLARKELRRIERETNVATVIRAVESLRGQKLAEAATRAARQSEIEGIFILIARSEKEIELLVSKKYAKVVTRERQATIRAAFVEGFKKRDFDLGLKLGVAAIGEQVAAARGEVAIPEHGSDLAAPKLTPSGPAGGGGASALVVRNQVRLGLAGARAIIAAAIARATEMTLKLNVAVVDDGGHLVAFERMDGARPASLYTAITKATSAATYRQPTGPLAAGGSPADPLLNLSLQNAAEASGGKITALQGGVPVVVDGQVIGAVGIAGGTGEQDAQVARSAVQAFMDQLTNAQPPATAAKPSEKPE